MTDPQYSPLQEDIFCEFEDQLKESTDICESVRSELLEITRLETSGYDLEESLDKLEEISAEEINEN